MGWASWRAARAARPEFVKASQARIWRITTLAVVSILGATFAVVAFAVIVNRLSRDEDCLRSVAVANSTRSSVLSRLSMKRTDADNLRQAWNTAEQRAFAEKLHQKTRADARKVRRDFTRALHGYLRADSKYRRLNVRYNQAAQAHPVPKLRCTAGQLNQPAPTVTATSTATATRTATPLPSTVHATATATAPPPRVIPGRTVTRTVFAPPGKGRTVTVTQAITVTVTATNPLCTLVPGVDPC